MDCEQVGKKPEIQRTFCLKCLQYKNGKFCNRCGMPLAIKPEKCSFCKVQSISHYDDFCRNCGQKIVKEIRNILKGLDSNYSYGDPF